MCFLKIAGMRLLESILACSLRTIFQIDYRVDDDIETSRVLNTVAYVFDYILVVDS